MVSKLGVSMCGVALIALAAIAQEKTNRPDAQGGTQPGTAQSRTGEAQRRTAENQTRSTDNQNRNDRSTTTTADQNQNRTVDTRELHRTTGSDNKLDAHLAACLILGNQKEVEISRFAAGHAQNEKVKKFAQDMVEHHTQAIAKLQKFTGSDTSPELNASPINRTETNVNERSSTTTERDATRSDSKSSNAPRGARREATSSTESAVRTPADSTTTPPADANARTATSNDANRNQAERADQNRPGVAGQSPERGRSVTTSVEVRSEHEAMPDRMKAIEREVANKWVSLMKSKLEQCPSFDQGYMGAQIGGHIAMIAHLETYRSYASEELRAVIQEGHSMAQDHLRQATEIAEELAKSSPGEARRGTESRTQPGADQDATKRTDRSETTTEGRRAARNEGGNADKRNSPK